MRYLTGCTGLALAHGLKKVRPSSAAPMSTLLATEAIGLESEQSLTSKQAGFAFEIYERDERNTKRTQDWSFSMHWAAPTLQSLIPEELFAQIQTAQADPHTSAKSVETLPFMNGETGESMGGIDTKGLYRLNRSKTQALLMEGLDVHFVKTLNAISFSDDGKYVTAHFADGTNDTGSILVGTDGPHSCVRSLLVDPVNAKVTPIDFAAIMCFAKFDREQALFLRSEPHHPLFQCGIHPEGYMAWLALVDAPDPSYPEEWTFTYFISFTEPRDLEHNVGTNERVTLVKSLAKIFPDPFKSAFEWMPDSTTTIEYKKMRHWDPSAPNHKWDNHNGRVTLAGDAAHPMTYTRGQGLNYATDDAGKLCEAIKNCKVGKAGFLNELRRGKVEEYEKNMVRRAGEEVRLGEINATMLHDWNKVLESPLFKMGLENGV